MAKLYRARLFRLMLEDEENSQYEAYRIGTIIVSRKGKNCKEFLYGVNLPVFDSKMGYITDNSEHIGGFSVGFFDEKDTKNEYIVLREDLSDKNLMTNKDMIKFDYDQYASMSMKLKQYEDASVKKLFKTKNGVIYGKSVGRS
jgi:hypothetical protein